MLRAETKALSRSMKACHPAPEVAVLPTDFPAGGILNVPGILMKQGEQTRSVPLAGLAVKVTMASI